LPAAVRTEAVHKLRGACRIGVREHATRQALAASGIDAALLPDCVSLVAELFGARIARHGRRGEPAAIATTFATTFARGYLALQFNAGFGDDATLDTLADRLERIARRHRLGIVAF